MRGRLDLLQNPDMDYREGFHFERRVQKENCGENGERTNVYGGNQIGGTRVGSDHDPWGEGEREGIGGEEDFRDIGREGSEVSQSEGSEDRDENNGESENCRGIGGSSGSVLGKGVVLSPQMTSLEGRTRQESMMASRIVEGFQRPDSDRDTVTQAPNSASFRNSLQPVGLPFITYQQAPSSGAHKDHMEANSAQNGRAGDGGATPGSYGTREGGISRDCNAGRECAMGRSIQEQQSQAHLGENALSSEENYYTSLLTPTTSNSSNPPKGKDLGNEVGGGQKRNVQLLESPSTAELSLRRILSDPISGLLMDDASIFGCGHSFGAAGLARVIETNVCITCGASVRVTSMAPNYVLRAAVQAYKLELENSFSKMAKRRKDLPEQDQGTLVEQQSDTSRSKGVQFPFAVSDRVLIKGNKRTPERFVGRKAVITSQCLNGWYLVRTLDNGESVRLQYRSLQRLGDLPSANARHFGPATAWL